MCSPPLPPPPPPPRGAGGGPPLKAAPPRARAGDGPTGRLRPPLRRVLEAGDRHRGPRLGEPIGDLDVAPLPDAVRQVGGDRAPRDDARPAGGRPLLLKRGDRKSVV